MHIEKFPGPETGQMAKLGKHHWSVARLFTLTTDMDVFEIPLKHLNVYYTYEKLTLREMAMHFNAVKSANLDYPIILDEDGEVMDGRHRIMKAIIDGVDTIKAVRFDKNPEPCLVDD